MTSPRPRPAVPHAALAGGVPGLALRLWLGLGLGLGLGLAACTPPDGDAQVPDADPVMFAERVYPVVLADCGFNVCHGDPARAFAVFGPGRRRLRAETDLDAPVTAEELAVSFTRARSMLVSREGLQRAPLLRKPLSVAAGGVGHRGTDPWGHGIYASKDDPRFQVLVVWALASTP